MRGCSERLSSFSWNTSGDTGHRCALAEGSGREAAEREGQKSGPSSAQRDCGRTGGGRQPKMRPAVRALLALGALCALGGCLPHGTSEAAPTQASGLKVKRARGDNPDIFPEPEPTNPTSDFENSYNYVLSRLAVLDQSIHKLNVGQYTLDVKVNQLIDRLTRIDVKVAELEDNIREVHQHSKDNRKELGRLEGCQKGRRVGYKCYLVYNSKEDYAGASRKCIERGGRMAMPRDRKEQEALADYVKTFFHPGNWPVWLGITDLRSEGTYVFDDGTRVSYFQWRRHFLSSQPDGGKRENCVAMSSDDGDWWDHYCDRTMNYLCEFDDRVGL